MVSRRPSCRARQGTVSLPRQTGRRAGAAATSAGGRDAKRERERALKPLLILREPQKSHPGVFSLPIAAMCSANLPAHSKFRVSDDRHNCEWLPRTADLRPAPGHTMPGTESSATAQGGFGTGAALAPPA